MKKYLIPISVLPLIVIAVALVCLKIALGASPSPEHNNGSPTDIFYHYSPYSNVPRSNQTPFDGDVLSSSADFYGTSANTPTKFTFTDINGDNLPDFLYHERGASSSSVQYYAAFLNNGNNNFNLAYKCVRSLWATNPNRYTAYWDCASNAPVRDPNAPENQNMLAQVLYLANYYYSSEAPVSNHIWIDINGDGLQDYIDACLNINPNRPDGMYRFAFTKTCS